MNFSTQLDIELPSPPKSHILKDICISLNTLIEDIIIYIAYIIAVICGFKFIIYIVNGFATKSYMGSQSMDDSSFIR
jgi:hypothetical protein